MGFLDYDRLLIWCYIRPALNDTSRWSALSYLEWCLKPQRGCHDEHLLQPCRIGALQEGEHLLAEVVVKVGILGARHVVNEYKTPTLGLGLELREIRVKLLPAGKRIEDSRQSPVP